MDPGVINVIVSISKLLPKRPAAELLVESPESSTPGPERSSDSFHEGKWLGPTIIVQGYLDPLNAEERANKLVSLRSGITLAPIQAGHCPHDELPEEVGKTVSRWLNDSVGI